MRILPYFAIGSVGAAIGSFVGGSNPSTVALVAFATGFGCAFAASLAYAIKHRKLHPAELLVRGECPECRSTGEIVKIAKHAEGLILGCTACRHRFDIREDTDGEAMVLTVK